MTTQEFSDQIDVLLDSHRFIDEFGKVNNDLSIKLDEYEKSVFLTEAQDIVLKDLFINGFDKNEQIQMYHANLIKTASVSSSDPASASLYSDTGKLYELPDDLFWILNERVKDDNQKSYVVKPIHFKEYDRLMSKSYTKPLKKQAWRLISGNSFIGNPSIYSEIITRNTGNHAYILRYIRKPKPIILEDISPLNIRGASLQFNCELHESIHPDILYKTIELIVSRYAPQIRQKPVEQQQIQQ